MTQLWLWRHPRCTGAAGRCIGRTDLPLDPRRAKRLAHRVRQAARRAGLPREVWTSPLQRCRDVGRWLRCWGWRHRVDERLLELHFGAWEGRRWTEIARAEVAAWEAAFVQHAPGDGEPLASLLARVQRFVAERSGPVLIVAHAGWMQALQWLREQPPPEARHWPRAPRHGELVRVDFPEMR